MDTAHMLRMSDEDLCTLVENMRVARYETSWRNYEGRWRDLLGLDTIKGKFVTDFGCGNGIESLELAKAGNHVTLADIAPGNLAIASRIFSLHGYKPVECILVDMQPPFFPVHKMDVFYASGVIHHIPWADFIMQRAYECLPAGGEARLMLYSEKGWRVICDSEPPEDTPSHPEFQKFVQYYDQVGEYADWYSAEKIQKHFSQFRLERWGYITPNDRYLGAVLRKD